MANEKAALTNKYNCLTRTLADQKASNHDKIAILKAMSAVRDLAPLAPTLINAATGDSPAQIKIAALRTMINARDIAPFSKTINNAISEHTEGNKDVRYETLLLLANFHGADLFKKAINDASNEKNESDYTVRHISATIISSLIKSPTASKSQHSHSPT